MASEEADVTVEGAEREETQVVTIVCVSDTHVRHRKLRVPPGDILVHCGDGTVHGGQEELEELLRWLSALPHAHKVAIAGNHDRVLDDMKSVEEKRALFARHGCLYLEDEAVSVCGLRFYGMPWCPAFVDRDGSCVTYYDRSHRPGPTAFMLLPKSSELLAHVEAINGGGRVDVLVTHGPPYGSLDVNEESGEHIGCRALREVLSTVRPCLHLFGHVHEGRGVTTLSYEEQGEAAPAWRAGDVVVVDRCDTPSSSVLVNASSFSRKWLPKPPIVVRVRLGASS